MIRDPQVYFDYLTAGEICPRRKIREWWTDRNPLWKREFYRAQHQDEHHRRFCHCLRTARTLRFVRYVARKSVVLRPTRTKWKQKYVELVSTDGKAESQFRRDSCAAVLHPQCHFTGHVNVDIPFKIKRNAKRKKHWNETHEKGTLYCLS